MTLPAMTLRELEDLLFDVATMLNAGAVIALACWTAARFL